MLSDRHYKRPHLSLFLSDLGVDKSIEKKPKIKNILFREQPQNTLYGTYMVDTMQGNVAVTSKNV